VITSGHYASCWPKTRKNWNDVATLWLKIFEDMFIRFDRVHVLDQATLSLRLRPKPWSPARQFTLHASAHREDRVDVLLSPPPT